MCTFCDILKHQKDKIIWEDKDFFLIRNQNFNIKPRYRKNFPYKARYLLITKKHIDHYRDLLRQYDKNSSHGKSSGILSNKILFIVLFFVLILTIVIGILYFNLSKVPEYNEPNKMFTDRLSYILDKGCNMKNTECQLMYPYQEYDRSDNLSNEEKIIKISGAVSVNHLHGHIEIPKYKKDFDIDVFEANLRKDAHN